ncbi:MAG: VOC family protein [Desulfuromonadales bacterium]|nr:VOC family protein [Desulfuromonadales bacterium]MDW7758513.1 VOC family protein [Desulfuromonadales bacterium]
MDYQMIHVCLRVFNLEASEKFYREAFGFEVSRRLDFDEQGFTLCYMRAPGQTFELELTHNHDRDKPYEIGDGYSHIAVSVKDLEASHQRHEELGLSPRPIKGLGDAVGRFYFLADPDGYMVEVIRA